MCPGVSGVAGQMVTSPSTRSGWSAANWIAPRRAARERDEDRPVGAGRVEHGTDVVGELEVGVRLAPVRRRRQPGAPAVERDDPVATGERGDLGLPEPGRDDRPRRQQGDRRLARAEHLPVQAHAVALDVTDGVGLPCSHAPPLSADDDSVRRPNRASPIASRLSMGGQRRENAIHWLSVARPNSIIDHVAKPDGIAVSASVGTARRSMSARRSGWEASRTSAVPPSNPAPVKPGAIVQPNRPYVPVLAQFTGLPRAGRDHVLHQLARREVRAEPHVVGRSIGAEEHQTDRVATVEVPDLVGRQTMEQRTADRIVPRRARSSLYRRGLRRPCRPATGTSRRTASPPPGAAASRSARRAWRPGGARRAQSGSTRSMKSMTSAITSSPLVSLNTSCRPPGYVCCSNVSPPSRSMPARVPSIGTSWSSSP